MTAPFPERPERHPVLCLVTARRRLAPDADEREAADRVIALVDEAVHAGIDLVQIRERDLGAGSLADLVARAVRAARGSSTRIVVNDRVDVALACCAAGAHLRGDSVAAPRVRVMTPPGFLLGRSVHGADGAAAAAAHGGLDYLILGTIFPSRSKPEGHPAIGVEALARAVRAASLPVLAIGGIALNEVPKVARAGAAGVAAIELFVAASGRLRALVNTLDRLFDTSRPVS